jgi:peptidoglycan hydrolase CwlO-like protein
MLRPTNHKKLHFYHILSRFFTVIIIYLLAVQPVTAQTEPISSPSPSTAAAALIKLQENQAQLQAKQSELSNLDGKIKELSQKQASASNEAELAADQLAYVSQQLQAAQLQYDQTLLSITILKQDIGDSETEILSLESEADQTRQLLRESLRALYQQEQSSLLDVVLGSTSLSALMSERRTYYEIQQRALQYVSDLQQRQKAVAEHIMQLDLQHRQMQQLKDLQAFQQADLSEQQDAKDNFLKLKQQQQAQYAREIAETKQARTEIEQQLFSLKGLGVDLALNDAYQAARFAGSLTRIRPALLLGIVKVETNVGATLGSGRFPDDMHPSSRDAFLELTSQLKLDPFTTPISRRPSNYQGWGGAMGPGQFMPSTWLGLAPRISQLINKPVPDPFSLADALVGVGIMMADRGASDPAKEAEAVGRYLAGPNWQYHLWYSARVLAVAAEYEKEGLQ